MTFNIAIIGLDITGTSIGLALGEYKEKVTRIGVDRDHDHAKKAQSIGAVDKIERNLPSAAENADLILLCEPTAEALETLGNIARDLTDTKYLFDLGCAADLFNQELTRLVPQFSHHVNLSITVNPDHLHEITMNTESASADLFRNGILFVSTTGQSSPDAVELAETLSSMLKTSIVFTDPVELDGLRASTQLLPEVLSSTLVQVVTGQAGWRESRRLTDRGFFHVAAPVYLSGTTEQPAKNFLANRDTLVQWIDLVVKELQTIRQHLVDGNEKELNAWWKSSLQQLIHVQTNRQVGDWDIQSQPRVEIPTLGERLGKLIGLGKKKK